MWESIGKVMSGSNGPLIIIGILLILILVVLMTRSGMLHVNVKGIKIGSSERDMERALIREQCSWASAYLHRLEAKIREFVREKTVQANSSSAVADAAVAATAAGLVGIDRHTGINDYLTKYIMELEYDEVVNWIVFNHISEDKTYVSMKQTKILGIIYANVQLDLFKSKEFVDMLCEKTEEMIHGLIAIRKLYEEKK